MDLEVKKINRQVEFIFAQIFDDQDSTGKNNTWVYNRAPDGYKFVLIAIDSSITQLLLAQSGVCAIYDGHEYTHWNQWPGVESRELLARVEHNNANPNTVKDLHGWECKEFTIGVRSLHSSNPVKVCAIVWYYLEKMTPDETKMYAVMQPRGEHFRKGGPTTLTEGEETV